MDLTVPEEVAELGRAARGALADPGLDRARRAMDGDRAARDEVAAALDGLGLAGLDPRQPVDLLAAGHLALESGRVGALVPVAARLAATAAGRDGLLQARSEGVGVDLFDHADAGGELALVDVHGTV